MRGPVYSRGSNPSIDPPIFRKSLSYLETQVRCGAARPVDSSDLRKGIIALSRLPYSDRIEDSLSMKAGGFDTAWSIRQSGFAGPLVWQLNRV
jgi:hypothetical protein